MATSRGSCEKTTTVPGPAGRASVRATCSTEAPSRWAVRLVEHREGASRSSARARPRRCRWPGDSVRPPLPSTCRTPAGGRTTKAWAPRPPGGVPRRRHGRPGASRERCCRRRWRAPAPGAGAPRRGGAARSRGRRRSARGRRRARPRRRGRGRRGARGRASTSPRRWARSPPAARRGRTVRSTPSRAGTRPAAPGKPARRTPHRRGRHRGGRRRGSGTAAAVPPAGRHRRPTRGPPGSGWRPPGRRRWRGTSSRAGAAGRRAPARAGATVSAGRRPMCPPTSRTPSVTATRAVDSVAARSSTAPDRNESRRVPIVVRRYSSAASAIFGSWASPRLNARRVGRPRTTSRKWAPRTREGRPPLA